MTFPECQKAASSQHHGIYSRDCLACCKREVIGARKLGKGVQMQIISSWVKCGVYSEREILAYIRGEA